MEKNEEKEYLLALKRGGNLKRQGIVFHTSDRAYLYDAGTGKVAVLDDDSTPIIMALFNDDVDLIAFEDMLSCNETTESIAQFLRKEHLLMRPEKTEFYDWTPLMSDEALQCQQLIIELTGQCNLRCKYCIYNDHYGQARKFNQERIDFDTAKKAIDYAYAHRSPKFFAVGFYGGEPLLNFKVMKQCIDYCLTAYKDVKPTFSFTTNLTLMTEEIAEYLARVPNMSIIASVDGPEDIQNRNRTFANGAPTFDAVYRGLKYLCNAINKNDSNCHLSFNSVFMPPYTAERFSEINDFFESLTFLPPNAGVTATYPAPGSIPDDFLKQDIEQGYKVEDTVEWMDWSMEKMERKGDLPNSPNLYTNVLQRTLGDIHNRRILTEPITQYCRNACCIPGNRRLYVCTDGHYKLCEKMGESPFIGHVDTGLDFDAIKKYYLDQYDEAFLPDCEKCWAVNLCGLCYCRCYNKDGVDIQLKCQSCEQTRATAMKGLRIYHEVNEKYPEIINQVSRLERS